MKLEAPPPILALEVAQDPAPNGTPMWQASDVALARSLFTIWAIRTGRLLRAVPVTELTPTELIDFWADDQLDEPPSR